MSGTIAPRGVTDLSRNPGADRIVSATLELTNEIREKPESWAAGQVWKEFELTGRTFGRLYATIADPSMDYGALMGRPVVFQWPDRLLFLLVVIDRIAMTAGVGDLVTVDTEARVLRVAEYGGLTLPEHARARLLGAGA